MGILPWSRDAWKINQCLISRRPGISSGPVALCGLVPRSSFNTSFLLTTMDWTLGWSVEFNSETELRSSSLKTDVNWSLKMLAFLTLSLLFTPFDVRGATPLASHFLDLMKECSF